MNPRKIVPIEFFSRLSKFGFYFLILFYEQKEGIYNAFISKAL